MWCGSGTVGWKGFGQRGGTLLPSRTVWVWGVLTGDEEPAAVAEALADLGDKCRDEFGDLVAVQHLSSSTPWLEDLRGSEAEGEVVEITFATSGAASVARAGLAGQAFDGRPVVAVNGVSQAQLDSIRRTGLA